MASSSWSPAAIAGYLLIVVFWGFNYLFVNLGLEFASPLWLAALRAGVGALSTLAIVSGFGGWGTLDRAGKRDALLLGIPNTALFFGLWFWAARSVLPGIAAVVVYTFPLWVALLSRPVLGQALTGRHWASVAVGFVGVALISEIGQTGSAGVAWLPIVALLVAAISWAVGTVLFQRRFRPVQMMSANAYQLIGGAVALLVAVAVLSPNPLPRPTVELGETIVWLGVLGTAVAYAFWAMLLGRIRAATLSAYVFLVPVVALAASAVIFGERLSWTQLLGVGLVLISIYGIGRAQGASAAPSVGGELPAIPAAGEEP
ncbi:MAG: DMT family transporter [Thermoplasmata archaeon]